MVDFNKSRMSILTVYGLKPSDNEKMSESVAKATRGIGKNADRICQGFDMIRSAWSRQEIAMVMQSPSG
jgi:hypothetical protein